MIETCFYYYGVVVPLGDPGSQMLALKAKFPKDIYCFILDHDLQYRRVGNVYQTHRIVIGRELAFFPETNPYNLVRKDPFIKLDEKDIQQYKLSNAEQRVVEQNLYKVGCIKLPQYLCAYNCHLDLDEQVELRKEKEKRLGWKFSYYNKK